MKYMDDKGAERLVEAIVVQAVEDYKRGVKSERRSRERGHFVPSALKREVERFFRSGRFEELTGLDGAAVLARLEGDA